MKTLMDLTELEYRNLYLDIVNRWGNPGAAEAITAAYGLKKYVAGQVAAKLRKMGIPLPMARRSTVSPELFAELKAAFAKRG